MLADYNATTGVWGGVGQGGDSTDPNQIGSGGLATINNYLFATDMDTPSGPEHGLIFFGLNDNSIGRVASDTNPIDVTAGGMMASKPASS